MLVRCKQEGADIRVEKIRSGHSPFLKVPEQVAEIIDKVSSGAVE